MKKILTILILGLAMFTVSCEYNDPITNTMMTSQPMKLNGATQVFVSQVYDPGTAQTSLPIIHITLTGANEYVTADDIIYIFSEENIGIEAPATYLPSNNDHEETIALFSEFIDVSDMDNITDLTDQSIRVVSLFSDTVDLIGQIRNTTGTSRLYYFLIKAIDGKNNSEQADKVDFITSMKGKTGKSVNNSELTATMSDDAMKLTLDLDVTSHELVFVDSISATSAIYWSGTDIKIDDIDFTTGNANIKLDRSTVSTDDCYVTVDMLNGNNGMVIKTNGGDEVVFQF